MSALDFTSVFEMGTGVALKLYAPENFKNFILATLIKLLTLSN